MLDLVNKTPFAAAMLPALDKDGAEYLVVAVKASYAVTRTRGVVLADEQAEVRRTDDHYGEPGASSVRYEADGALRKPGVDVAVVGSAFGPSAGASQLDLELRVGSARKVVRVFGPRIWTRGGRPGPCRPSAPNRIAKVPLIWERAFGGCDTSHADARQHASETRNPVGTGFFAPATAIDPEGTPAPQLESPHAPLTQQGEVIAPAGFGFVARSWSPRRELAGSYDGAWQRDRAPLLPLDFDDRHYLGTPSDLGLRELRGGEPIAMTHVLPGGTSFELTLPRHRVEVVAEVGTRSTSLPARLDTLVLEPEAARVIATFRAAIPLRRRLLDIDRVRVREVAS